MGLLATRPVDRTKSWTTTTQQKKKGKKKKKKTGKGKKGGREVRAALAA